MAYKAIIAGATGLIGSKLLNILLNERAYNAVVILVRKPTGIKHDKLTEIIVDYDKLDDYTGEINGHAIFSCLGTTKSKTPNLDVYYKIEHDYPVKLAQLAADNSVNQFHYISSIGANKNASSYYTKFKGQTEYDLQQIKPDGLHIYRPSLITGDRKEFRLLERIAGGLMYVVDPLLIGSLKKYRSIPAQTVAMAMFKQSITNTAGVFIHPSDNIKQIA